MSKKNKYNPYTQKEIGNLKKIVEDNKNLLLTGGIAVGKTYIAEELAKELTSKEENIFRVSLHPGYGYEDFVRGISVKTKDKKINFEEENKILLNLARKANKVKKDDENIVLILDDINRCDTSSVFGNMLDFIDRRNLSKDVIIPNNFYIIATMNTAISSDFGVDYGLLRKFMIYNLESDYRFIEANENDENRKRLYHKVNEFIKDNINYRYRKEINKYLIGHGLFAEKNYNIVEKNIKYRVIVILEEYIRDGI
ncbi:AAA family ATPase, partial [Romboutsia sp.]|uniref:AAA family ATPase n=1 Tax=Romboutsia sp. TaxID=1965302 RepID=UPI003F40F239